jgi:hypothetical protein
MLARWVMKMPMARTARIAAMSQRPWKSAKSGMTVLAVNAATEEMRDSAAAASHTATKTSP